MMRRRLPPLALAAVLAAIAAPLSAQTANDPVKLPNPTQPTPSSGSPTAPAPIVAREGSDTLNIGGIGSARGAVAINGAAGFHNSQMNAGVIASGPNAVSTGNIFQFSQASGEAGGSAHALIAPGTLAGSSGWLAVSGAAGADNQQANLAVMAFGSEGLAATDLTLAQTRASTIPMGENGATDASPSRSVAIGQGAFKESSGIVQLSLVGGDRNTSANSFALLVAGTAKPE